VLSTTLYGIVM